jgi:hypothetical protein
MDRMYSLLRLANAIAFTIIGSRDKSSSNALESTSGTRRKPSIPQTLHAKANIAKTFTFDAKTPSLQILQLNPIKEARFSLLPAQKPPLYRLQAGRGRTLLIGIVIILRVLRMKLFDMMIGRTQQEFAVFFDRIQLSISPPARGI